MISDEPAHSRITGSLRSSDGKGVVRIQDRFDSDIHDVWSALTEPARLARWLGEVDGDLRLGGEFRLRFYASGWEGNIRVRVCEPPRRLLLTDTSSNEPDDKVTEVTLTADGDQTILVFEQRGMPVQYLPAYGAGNQVHIEDLAAHLAEGERCDAHARWRELEPAYKALAVNVDQRAPRDPRL